MYTVRVTSSKNSFDTPKLLKGPAYRRAINRAMTNLGLEIIQHAQEVYASKRKSTNPISMIMDSFVYDLDSSGNVQLLTVSVGGIEAPHARFVEYPRQSFPGYFFMEAGKQYGMQIFIPLIREELRKLFTRGR